MRLNLSKPEIIRTFNRFHLGDNLIHLQFLRRIAQANPGLPIEHKAHAQYIPAMQMLITDLPQIQLTELTEQPEGFIDAWRGCNGFWYSHPKRHDFTAFHLEHFALLSERMGVPCPVKSAEDMLWDSPALQPDTLANASVDVLIINSAPQSNQWPQYDAEKFLQLQRELRKKGLRTINSDELRAQGWPIAVVGALAGQCQYVIGTAHGPFWVCRNVWANKTLKSIVAMTGNNENLDGLGANVHTTTEIMDALNFL